MHLNRKILLLILISFLCIYGFGQMRVMTLNIRYDTSEDGENWWENRKEEVVQLIDFYQPGILGIQEALVHQLTYINNNLTNYSYAGVGRDDGEEKGEFSAILYDTVKFKLFETKTFWLSKTPDTVSIGWDASMKRICTFGAFIDHKTRDSIFVFNCHFDHLGIKSRKMSAKLILKKINEFGIVKKQMIVMGDLNCEPQDKPIQIFKKELDDGLEISEQRLYGPDGTFNAFNLNTVVDKRIDYILTKNLMLRSYRHVDDRRKNNLYISDHFPVLVEIIDRTEKSHP